MNKISKSEIDATLELYDEMTCEEEIETVGNSFFERMYFGTRILVFAEKFGDEILVAGNMILNFIAARAEIFIAYSNGDKKFAAENISALEILGVQQDKIIFLNKKNLSADLKKILLKLRANIIFCVDYDSNSGLSSIFEKVMGEILRERQDYQPEIYKKLSCATALNAPPDFYAPNLLSVKRPKIGTTDNYNFDLIDCANYDWAGRVRFPVPEKCRKTLLKNNPLAAAIFAYKSKKFSALRILNSDEVFFERRTDNQIFSAKISASSGVLENVADFKIFGECWKPEIDDSKKILKFEWAEGVQVQQIKIYGNTFDKETAKLKIRLKSDNLRVTIDKAGISLDNIQVMENILPSHGCPLILDTEKIFVQRAEIEVLEGGKNFGISEVEFFANVDPLKKIAPFIKLTVGKNFFYRYDVPYEIEKIPLGLYKFHVSENVKLTATSNDEEILSEVFTGDNEIILNLGGAKEIILTAEVIGNPNIYDKAIIRRVGDWAQIQLKVLQWIDKINFRH